MQATTDETRTRLGAARARRHAEGAYPGDAPPAPDRAAAGADAGTAAHTGAPRHAAPSPDPARGPIRRGVATVRDYLPRGNLLDDATFRRRHLLLSWILGLHIPVLFAFGVWQGYGVRHSALEVAVPAALLVFGQLARHRRVAAFFVTAGLVFCSTVLVHLSSGNIEAHFHFFILIGLIALYEDWVPFVWNVVFVVLSHGLGNTFAADLMYNHSAAQNRPWHWAVIHGVSVLAACAGVIIFWRNVEQEKERSAALASELGEAELAAVQAEAARRRTVSQLYVNLARRNQSLLDRQLNLIAALEQQEREPDVLGELFQLDHLATRMRRNAESLIVLSGAEPARLWRQAIPLADVVRAAAAEVEQYQRVDVQVGDHLTVAGRNVADLAHLLAELLENATTFSPPSAEVRVRSHPTPNADAPYLISIEDVGLGMPDDELDAANAILADPPELDAESSRLGFQVVGRLAQRLGLRVSVAPTPAGGTTALVTLPDGIVTNERSGAAPPAPSPAPSAAFAAGTAVGQDRAVPPAPSPAAAPRRPQVEIAPPPHQARASWSSTPAPPPAPPASPAPAPTAAAPLPTPPTGPPAPATTANGLPQRVPGHNLAPGLRQDGGPPFDAEDAGDSPGQGLARRVPGAHLAPGLRRRPDPGDAADAGTPPGDAGTPPGDAAAAGATAAGRDNFQAGAMLSRFQASQRAGRAAASTERNGHDDDQDLPPEDTDQ